MKTKFNRRTILTAGAAAALTPGAALFASPAGAQAWPSKPIRWVVPYTAGGLTDSVTRLTLEKTNVGQTFVVDNKPGANSLIGAEAVATATPDGYTFLTVIAAHAANKTLYDGKLKFDPVTSFAPVSLVGIAPIMILVSNDMPVKSVGELIDYAKKNPGKISFGSWGVGSAAHLSTELIMQVTGTKMVHVPYKGTAPALNDLMAGNLQLLLDVPIGTMSQVRAGKARALAMMSKDR
ncbi:MAG: tripartite tricarboxylate transporter substrate binding protein, partial [Alphaproteobacteria bacterium]|nr:tripartite tricarboxylate transporter substrate binding protein [Alphaproteobacteria bacterium]